MIKVVNKHTHQPTSNDVYIGRGSILGNPYSSIKDRDTKATVICDTREESIAKFRQHIELAIKDKVKPYTRELNRIYKLAKEGDVNLVCFCSPKSCHGDVIKEIIESKL